MGEEQQLHNNNTQYYSVLKGNFNFFYLFVYLCKVERYLVEINCGCETIFFGFEERIHIIINHYYW